MISYGRQSINDDDVNAVCDVLKHQNLTQGPQVPAFERALCEYTGARHAVAVNSGTAGLHVACLGLGIGKGDLVYTTPNSFVASANCALYCGAEVDFIDIDPATRQMDVDALADNLALAKSKDRLPKAVIVVHFAGHSCDMKAFAELAQRYEFTLIEDNAHGLGGQYQGDYATGYPKYSAVTVCSFHPVKSITTCEGGAVLTNDETLANRMRLFASHGITKNADDFVCPQPGAGHFEQQCLGFNYRLSDVHAALGISQLKRLDSFIEKRWALAQRYQQALQSLPVTLPVLDKYSAWHLYVIELRHHQKQKVFAQLVEKGIGVNVHYIPIHWHPYYQQLGFGKGQFPCSEQYYRQALTLPLFPTLSADIQDTVVSALYEILV